MLSWPPPRDRGAEGKESDRPSKRGMAPAEDFPSAEMSPRAAWKESSRLLTPTLTSGHSQCVEAAMAKRFFRARWT